MRFRLSSVSYCLPVLFLALLVCGALAAGKQRGRSIEISAPKSDEVATNLNQLGSKKDGLKQLEDDLNKPLQTFSPKSSLEGVIAPLPLRGPSAPVIPTKRDKELKDRRDNWMFMSPEDLTSGPTLEEIFHLREYGPDGQEKKKESALERFLEKSDRKGNRAKDKGSSKDNNPLGLRKPTDERDEKDESLPDAVQESEQRLKKLFEANPAINPQLLPSAPSAFSDVFGLGNALPERTPQQKARMDDFKQFLQARPPAVSDSLNSLGGVMDSRLSPPAGLDNFSAPSRRDAAPSVMGTIGSPFSSGGLPDLKGLGAQNQQRIEPVKIAPPTPVFTAPQRKF